MNTRRGFLGAGLAAGGALAIAGCGGDSLKRQLSQAPPVAQTDVALLNHLIDLEYRAVAAYTASLPLLHPTAYHAAKQFLAQELGHAEGLGLLVREAGGKEHKPGATYDLGAPKTSAQVLRLLHEVEMQQVAAYVQIIPRLGPAKVRTLTTQYFANDAQHISIVRSLQGQTPLPGPFVTGRE